VHALFLSISHNTPLIISLNGISRITPVSAYSEAGTEFYSYSLVVILAAHG
jgi:hypothetical protein